ncbi:MAG: cobalamin biosynthesis protein CbiA [Thermodesulfobacteriota bacterium]
MEIKLTGIVGIVGNYGSGKTEISINLAVNRKRAGIDVRVADLDLINPYFRTREAKAPLNDLGIEVVVPNKEYLQADLPIVNPAIAGLIRKPAQLTLLDVGGDDAGSTVLSSLADHLRTQKVAMLQVVNPHRPFTNTVAGCLKIKAEIESAARLPVTGLIGNANLIDETSVANIYEGYEFVTGLSRESGLPLEFITAATDLLPKMDMDRFSCPVLALERQLVPPWKKAAPLGIKNYAVYRHILGR